MSDDDALAGIHTREQQHDNAVLHAAAARRRGQRVCLGCGRREEEEGEEEDGGEGTDAHLMVEIGKPGNPHQKHHWWMHPDCPLTCAGCKERFERGTKVHVAISRNGEPVVMHGHCKEEGPKRCLPLEGDLASSEDEKVQESVGKAHERADDTGRVRNVQRSMAENLKDRWYAKTHHRERTTRAHSPPGDEPTPPRGHGHSKRSKNGKKLAARSGNTKPSSQADHGALVPLEDDDDDDDDDNDDRHHNQHHLHRHEQQHDDWDKNTAPDYGTRHLDSKRTRPLTAAPLLFPEDREDYLQRLDTFSRHGTLRWPHANPDAQAVARAGFVLVRHRFKFPHRGRDAGESWPLVAALEASHDMVCCTACHIFLRKFTPNDDPLREHRRHAGDRKCRFLNRADRYAHSTFALPTAWHAKVDPTTGRMVFKHSQTKETTYEHPLPEGWNVEEQDGRRCFTDAVTGVTSTQHPLTTVPEPWVKKLDEDGRPYFSDPSTHTTTLTHPLVLPDGWVRQLDKKTGRIRYVNAKTHETRFAHPTALGHADCSKDTKRGH